MIKTKTAKKLYMLVSIDFGPKFAFHASSDNDAVSKMRGWCRYHSVSPEDYTVMEETLNLPYENFVHDEYLN